MRVRKEGFEGGGKEGGRAMSMQLSFRRVRLDLNNDTPPLSSRQECAVMSLLGRVCLT